MEFLPRKALYKIATIEELVDHFGNYRSQKTKRMLILVEICQKKIIKVTVDTLPKR